MTTAQFINDLVDELAAQPVDHDAFNQYAPDDPNNAIRCANLRRYMLHMVERHPAHLLVMEAPGYRGCRLTGIPVTSRHVMLNGVQPLAMFGTELGYQDTDDIGFENIRGEQSATIVWNTLAQLRHTPLIWNTFPFHPHKARNPCSNRTPRKSERDSGMPFIQSILSFYRPDVVVAVGNVAHDTLMTMGINCVQVRHPAQGGKADFVDGLTRLL